MSIGSIPASRAAHRAARPVLLLILAGCVVAPLRAAPAWVDVTAGDGNFGDAALDVVATGDAVLVSGTLYRDAGGGTFVPRGFLHRHDIRTGARAWGVEIAPAGTALACGAIALIPAVDAVATGCNFAAGGYSVHVYGMDGTPRWSSTFANAGSGDAFGGLAVDAEGRVFLAGTLRSGGSARLRVHAFTPGGQSLWTQDYAPAAGAVEARALAADDAGGAVVVGTATNEETYIDGLVARIDAGGVAWARTFGGPAGGGIDEASAVAIAAGAVSVVGTVDRQTAAPSDGIALRYALDGTLAWQVRIDGPENSAETLAALAIAADGGVLAAGSAALPGGATEPLVAAIGSDGAVHWQHRGGSPFATPDRYADVATDARGTACAAGTATIVAGGQAIVLDCFDAAGAPFPRASWAGAQGIASARALAVDGAGGAVIAGSDASVATGFDAVVLRLESAVLANGFE